MQSTESAHFYMETKNKRTEIDKRVNMKYDPIVRRHVEYREAKVREIIMARPQRKPLSKERPEFRGGRDATYKHSDYALWQLTVLKPWLERNRKGGL